MIIMFGISFAWVLAVEFYPSANRPYVDSTSNNSMLRRLSAITLQKGCLAAAWAARAAAVISIKLSGKSANDGTTGDTATNNTPPSIGSEGG